MMPGCHGPMPRSLVSRTPFTVGNPGNVGNVGNDAVTPMAEPPQSPALPSELPVVPLRDAVVLPLTVAPLGVSRPVSVEGVNRALAGDRLVLLLMQKTEAEEPTLDDLHRV